MDKQAIFDKFVEFMGRFAEIRAVAALRDGFIMTTPFTVCGSVFLLIANLPIPGYPEFMANLFGKDWTAPLNAVAGGTFSVLALIAVLAITYKYVEAEGCDAIMASILSLSTFLIVLPPTVMGFLILICVGANAAVGKFLDTFGMRLVFTWQGAAVAAAVVSFPVMYRGIRGALEQVDPAVIQAGRTLGLGEFKILRKVMLPMAAPGILASVVLSFARCLGEFGATLMVAGNIPGETRTMSIAVYTAMQGGDRELAYKWVAIIVAYSLIILVGLNCLPALRRDRR